MDVESLPGLHPPALNSGPGSGSHPGLTHFSDGGPVILEHHPTSNII